MNVKASHYRSEYLEGELNENPESYLFLPLAYAYLTSDRLEEAEEVCKTGLEKHPYFTSARVLLGYVYHLLDNDQKASEELSIVLKENPGNLMAHRLMGKIYVRAGDKERGIEEYRKALSVCPSDEEATQALEKLGVPTRDTPSVAEGRESEAEPSDTPSGVLEEESEAASPDTPSVATEAGSKDEHFYARALADIFVGLGAVEEAVDVFSELPEKEIGKRQLQEKLRELETLLERERSLESEGASVHHGESSAFREQVERLKAELEEMQSGRSSSTGDSRYGLDALRGWLEAMGKKTPGDEGEKEYAQDTDPQRSQHESSGNEGTRDIRFTDSG